MSIGVQFSSVAERPAHDVPVHAGQHDVEQDRRVLLLAREPQPVGAVVRDVDREALRLETALEPLGQARLVVHHQQSHESIVTHAR